MTKMGFFKGALLGVVAGILLAPKSGKELRTSVKKSYEDISKRITEELSHLKEVTQETYTQIVNSVVHTFVEAKKITVEEAETIKDQLKQGYDKVRKTHEEAAKKENRLS